MLGPCRRRGRNQKQIEYHQYVDPFQDRRFQFLKEIPVKHVT